MYTKKVKVKTQVAESDGLQPPALLWCSAVPVYLFSVYDEKFESVVMNLIRLQAVNKIALL